ncbi:putative beta-galactosidase 7-like [Cocos nucifera]|uniref:Putative beta-galactosidase 7-like n=1 Tax=Cocos nucifera TaxID=13894 RepID=A0A8K0IF56_COCNU|nr:putative beta-galactosidase 7-like [Cocos nucifera]
MAKENAAKEDKTTMGLKKQLLEKFNEMAEKNKALLDLQGKVSKGEEKLLELQQELSKISDLETKIKKLEGTVTYRDDMLVARNKALLTYQRNLEH